MDANFRAFTSSELLPKQGRPARRSSLKPGSTILIGDREDIRLCDTLSRAVIRHNWRVQHGHIEFVDGRRYGHYSQMIHGRKVFLFPATKPNLNIFERKIC